MTIDLSQRCELIVQSEIRNMTLECNRVGGINLAQGVCDTETPREVIEAAHRAALDGVNAYTRYDGLSVLRQAIARKFREFNRLEVDPEGEIVCSAGATGAFYCACMALLNPGDEVIVIEPYYGYHVNTLLSMGAVPVFVSMHPPEWELDLEAVKERIGPRTKAIVVNTPSNPSGKVFTRAELKAITDLAVDHDLFVFSDEIYEYFVYDDQQHVSPMSFPDARERVVVISGYSKTFSITGWRIGYAACDRRWAKMIGYMNDLVYVCAPAPLQVGVAKGIEQLSGEFYRRLCHQHQAKRDMMVEGLREGGLYPYVPQGSYYILADVSSVPGGDSKERALQILKECGVASVPGSAFYHQGGEDLVRFCFAKKDDVLRAACDRLSRLRW
ncbi:MAG: Aspartate aminotransferase [Methanomassiliicoccales archaeon PtaB.Bin134]|jgi:aminotransferase|nr:MAG: Aspartate aminotransferase [Methanomassiliicoccales archaeon PtaB.Bin134]